VLKDGSQIFELRVLMLASIKRKNIKLQKLPRPATSESEAIKPLSLAGFGVSVISRTWLMLSTSLRVFLN